MTLAVQAGTVSFTTKVKAKTVQPRTYLFGSDTVAFPFQENFILVFRVDPEGARVEIKAKGANDFNVCTLYPSQTYALKVNNLSAIWAEADEDLRIHCAILPMP
ncbi:hypothetical protein [Rhizobium leguminosarum]|uniref:hypothetical protein n=1 Tax=Rhizobium leguminosarum TaxID=384 RepID=UPI0013F15B4D|nr:hypothetical protein [Rhizobium leguminosarum]